MKSRIIGSILILAILGALFLATEQESQPQTIQPVQTNDSAFKSLSIN